MLAWASASRWPLPHLIPAGWWSVPPSRDPEQVHIAVYPSFTFSQVPSIPAVLTLSKRLGAACPSNRHLLYSLEQRQVGFTTGLTIKTKFPRNNSQNTNRRAAMRQRVPPEQVVPRIQNRIWAVFRARTSDEICNWYVTHVTGPAQIIFIIKNWSSSDGTGIFLHKP